MDESAFIAAADALLEKLGLALDAALEVSDADIDWTLEDGILTIECEGGGKIIINRHVPNREIWVAARSGAFHFRADHGHWRDSRGHDDLATLLTRLVKAQAHIALRLTELPAPPES